MVVPVEFWVDVDAEVVNGFFGNFNLLGAVDWVVVFDSGDGLSSLFWVGTAVGESHEFAFVWVSGQSISEEPIQNLGVSFCD
jgi:hypothetical protein